MSKPANHFPLVMKSIAAGTGLVTIALSWLYYLRPADWILSMAITFGTTFYHFAMRLLAGALVPLFTKNVCPEQNWFRPRSWEQKLHLKLKVHRWKGRIPTYDPSQFDLSQNTLAQVVRNTCDAELVHEVIILFSFLPLFFAIPFGAFPVFVITSIFAAVYDSIFVIAQRYNRPRLVRILKKKEAAAHE